MSKRVLIIDDDMGIRKITQISLQAIANWEVLMAPSGREGITIAQTEQPDAILLDVMMPEMDGISTFQQLRANPATRAIPVILLTAKAQVFEQQQLAELPVAGIITKPFKAPDLVQEMCNLLHWDNLGSV